MPVREGIEKLPGGTAISATKGFLDIGEAITTITGVPFESEWLGIEKGQEQKWVNTLIQNPETARELALQEIQKEVIEMGTTESEKFGALLEAFPVGGGGAKWLGTIEDPHSNVNTIVTNIKAHGTMAMNMREKAFTGKMGDPYIAYDQVVTIQKDLAAMEMRVRLLIRESAELQAGSDEVNLIETEILDAKRRAFDAEQSAAAGIVAQASDSNIYLTLKELKEDKK